MFWLLLSLFFIFAFFLPSAACSIVHKFYLQEEICDRNFHLPINSSIRIMGRYQTQVVLIDTMMMMMMMMMMSQ